MRKQVIGLVLLVGAGVTSLAPDARACGVGYWCAEYAAPFDGATIPANAPALVQFTAVSTWYDAADVRPRASLLGPEGAEIQVATGPDGNSKWERLLVPARSLRPGAYVLVHGVCPGAADERNTFTVGPAAPLPSSIGTVQLEPLPVQIMSAVWVSGCAWTARASSVRIVFQPSEELRPWLALARFTLSIDGKEWQTSAYGTDRVSNFRHPDAISVLRPYTFCDPRFGAQADLLPAGGGSFASGSIPPGRHHARLSIHIAGTTADPTPLEFELVTTCGDVPDGRAGSSAGDAAADGRSSVDAGGETQAPNEGGGCTVAPVSAPSRAGALVLLAVCALAGHLRRSRR